MTDLRPFRAAQLTRVLAGLCLLASSHAFAQGKPRGKAGCVDAHVEAQELRQKGQLRAARERLDVCSREECPALVRKDCGTWLPEVEAATPSLVLEVRDESGRETSDVEVVIDDQRVAEKLSGRAIELDPGEHKVAVRAASGKVIEQTVIVREGERMRRVAVSFEPPAPPAKPPPSSQPPRDAPPPATTSGVSPLAWVLGGVAVVGVGAFATFAITGRSRQSDLEDCAPDCKQDDVDVMRREYLVADISLGVGLLAAAGAVYLFLASAPSKPPARATVQRSPVKLAPSGRGLVYRF